MAMGTTLIFPCSVPEGELYAAAARQRGEQVVAVVVAADPGRPPSIDQLRDHVKQELPAFAAPRELVLVDQLPRTLLGKVERHAL